MTTKQKDIAIGVSVIASVMVFALGMILWPYMPKDGKWLPKLYYLTTASTLYGFSLIIFITAKSKWWKIGSYFALSVCSVNLYVELFLDPTHWTVWSGGLIVAVGANVWLVGALVEKIKSKKDG